MVVAVPARYLWLVRVGVWLVYTAVAVVIAAGLRAGFPVVMDLPGIEWLIGGPLGLAGAMHGAFGFVKVPASAFEFSSYEEPSFRQGAQRQVIVPFLLEHPGSTVEEISIGTDLPRTIASRSLAYLQLDGLVEGRFDEATRQRRYRATDKKEEN